MPQHVTRMRRAAALVLIAAGGVLLAGCGERAQELQAKAPDAAPWSGKPTAFAGASGWTGGDQTAWEQQIRTRNQNQNEYGRAPATRP